MANHCSIFGGQLRGQVEKLETSIQELGCKRFGHACDGIVTYEREIGSTIFLNIFKILVERQRVSASHKKLKPLENIWRHFGHFLMNVVCQVVASSNSPVKYSLFKRYQNWKKCLWRNVIERIGWDSWGPLWNKNVTGGTLAHSNSGMASVGCGYDGFLDNNRQMVRTWLPWTKKLNCKTSAH